MTAAALAPFAASAGSATLKCAGYTGTETLENFQALIKLDEGRYGFKYAECADQTAGTDVWFSSDAAGDAVLEREIDTWNPGGSSYIWVKIPSLVAGTEITMHWGDAAKAQPAANTAVWTGYAGVWHMGKASGAETEPDATGHELDATASASTHTDCVGDTALMVAVTDGAVGGSRVNTTANNIANALIVPDYKNQLDDFYKFTIGGWFYQTAPYTPGGAGGNRMFCSRPAEPGSGASSKPNYYNGWEVASCYSSNQTDVDTKVVRVTSFKTSTAKSEFNATTTVERVVGRWVHYCVSFNRNSMKAYADGVLVNEGTIPDANLFTYVAGNGFWIGRFGNRASPFIGRYDEIRMYNGAMSADRVKADYDTMKTPTAFFTYAVTAQWTGLAGNGSISDAGNWLCKTTSGVVVEGAVPTDDMPVTVSGDAVDMQVPSGTTLHYATLAIADCTLSADCDWRGLGSVEISGTIALGGNTLTLADTKGSGTITGEGKLVVDVAEGKTVTNGSLTLSGAMQLEKTGEGTFTASKTGQTYTGGTVVTGGTFIPGANGTSRTTGASGSQITVGADGVFNLNGKCNFYDYGFVLDGGALKADASSSSPSADPCIASVTLVADSSFILDAHFGLINKKVNNAYAQVNLDLRGHTLTLHGGRALYMTNVKATQGRIVATGETFTGSSGGLYGTRINCHTPPASDLSAVELVMNGHSAVYVLPSPLKLGAYECNSTYCPDNTGYVGQMYVYGRFAPNTDRFYGATLQTGATLDLRERTGCFNTTGNGHAGTTADSIARRTLGFASGAAITVNLAGREDLGAIAKSDLPLVVQWATEPNATFTLDPETAKRFKLVKCAIETTDGETTTTVRGLRLRYKPGLIITVW